MSSSSTTLALLLATAVSGAVIAGQALAADTPSSEKCFGVAAAGKNDCQTPVSSCAGTSKVNGNPQAFILLPSGTCEKLTGGSLTAKK